MINLLASKKVLEGSEINVLHKLQDYWVVLSKDDVEDLLNNIVDNFYQYDENSLYNRLPYLKGKLDQPFNTTINVDYTTGEFNINPRHFHLGIPTHSSKSTRQVIADFSFIKWVFINRLAYVKFLVIELVLWLSAVYVGWFFYIPFVIYLILEILSLLNVRDLFKSGDLCPAIVLDEKDMRIAVLTDLTRAIGKYPLIRIKKVSLPTRYRKKGTLIPVAGGYLNPGKYMHWNYFIPFPLPSGISDTNVVEEKIKMIPLLEWVKLKSEIKKFQNDLPEGYYPIDIEKSSWKDSKLFDIKWVK